MDAMVSETMDYVIKKKGLPKTIVFYRDGVGEGQQQEIVEEELERILEYFEEKFKEKRPKMVYMIMTKRIDDLFFEKKGKFVNNVNPGTIIINDLK